MPPPPADGLPVAERIVLPTTDVPSTVELPMMPYTPRSSGGYMALMVLPCTVVFCTSILHLTVFSALIAAGLQFVPAGRAIVLGYTTPLWVAIGAAMFLSEDITRRRALGIVFGLAGLAVIFNPQTLNWDDRNALFGSGLILVAAFCWAGFVITTMVVNNGFAGRDARLLLIDGGHWLIVLLLMGAIIGGMGP